MFEQAELQGTQMGPNGPPNGKGTTLIAPEIASYRKPGLLGHFCHFCQNSHLFCHFGQPFPSQGGNADKKSHLGSCLNKLNGVFILEAMRPLKQTGRPALIVKNSLQKKTL